MKNTVSLVRISSVSQSENYGGTGIEFQTKKLSDFFDLIDLNHIEMIVDVVNGGLRWNKSDDKDKGINIHL